MERGWRPSRTPLGYKNDRDTKTIIPDPEHFPVVKRILELALTGAYTIKELHTMARDEWGYRTPKRKRTGGAPISVSTFYAMLHNPYYAGHFMWNGKLHQGKHEPMITLEEWEHLQNIVGRPGEKKPQKHYFPYTGMMRCGACGLMVTAENKKNRYGSRYVYYHCTKRNTGVRCNQPSVEAGTLEQQMISFLEKLHIDGEIHQLLLSQASELAETAPAEKENAVKVLNKTIADTEEQISTITDLRVRSLLDDMEFLKRREKLIFDLAALRERRENLERQQSWFEPAGLLISFSKHAVNWFMRGEPQVRRLILETVGSNYTLTNKKLNADAAKPFVAFAESPSILEWCGIVKDIRTLIEHGDPETTHILHNIRHIKSELDAKVEFKKTQ